jgi:hypothetical protein
MIVATKPPEKDPLLFVTPVTVATVQPTLTAG